jgi:hypothetical protein
MCTKHPRDALLQAQVGGVGVDAIDKAIVCGGRALATLSWMEQVPNASRDHVVLLVKSELRSASFLESAWRGICDSAVVKTDAHELDHARRFRHMRSPSREREGALT